MILFTPQHLGNIAQALAAYKREQVAWLNSIDKSSPDYADPQDFLISIDHTLSEVEVEYNKLRRETPSLMPFTELIRGDEL